MFVVISILSWQFSTFYKHIYPAYCVTFAIFAPTGENETIVISNTFTQEWEMEAYFDLAKQWNYLVTSLIVENRHGGVNIHGVPDDKLEQMKNRFEINL